MSAWTVHRRTIFLLALALAPTTARAQRRARRPTPPPQQQPYHRPPPDQTFDMVVGQEVLFDASGLQSHSLGRSAIEVRVTSDGRRLIFRAVSPGSTSLLLIYTNGDTRRLDFTVR